MVRPKSNKPRPASRISRGPEHYRNLRERETAAGLVWLDLRVLEEDVETVREMALDYIWEAMVIFHGSTEKAARFLIHPDATHSGYSHKPKGAPRTIRDREREAGLRYLHLRLKREHREIVKELAAAHVEKARVKFRGGSRSREESVG